MHLSLQNSNTLPPPPPLTWKPPGHLICRKLACSNPCPMGPTSQSNEIKCAVPENIHNHPPPPPPPWRVFCFACPLSPGNSSLASYFASKIVAFKTPLPPGISNYFLWGGYGFLWNCTNYNCSNFLVTPIRQVVHSHSIKFSIHVHILKKCKVCGGSFLVSQSLAKSDNYFSLKLTMDQEPHAKKKGANLTLQI